MKCTSCNERIGNTRCEGCNTLFCLLCMNQHHDELAQQFQSLMDIRNEVKQSLDTSRSKLSNRGQLSCFYEIDRWEREMTLHIQNIAANVRKNVADIIERHMNVISDRFEQISTDIQQRQKEANYIENDIERIRRQLNELKTEVAHVYDRIRIDSSMSNNIHWDTLIYVIEENSSNQEVVPQKTRNNKIITTRRDPIIGPVDELIKRVPGYISNPNQLRESSTPNENLQVTRDNREMFRQKICRGCYQFFDYSIKGNHCSNCTKHE